MNWLEIAGIVVFFLGILASIALHELGHMVPAKIFGVRVSQWMVGFGPTVWSKQIGETEYGVKAIPLGGYCRLIGMLPPRRNDEGELRSTSTGAFQGLVESARGAALEELQPGDETRVFYGKKWWQKVIVMLGGPGMNLVLALVMFGIVLLGMGTYQPTTTVAAVPECVVPATSARACLPTDPASPATKAGLKAGDKIVTFNGTKVTSWNQLSTLIRGNGSNAATIVVQRGGVDKTLTTHTIATERPSLSDPSQTVKVGYLGADAQQVKEREGIGSVFSTFWQATTGTGNVIWHMPQRLANVWGAAFDGKKRDANSPMGVVGASRLGGDIAAAKTPASDKIAGFLLLLGSLNVALGLMNLIPLLPLDGGHVAGALWEAVRRFFAKVVRRPDPGFVDVAKMLPITYVVGAVLLAVGALVIYADLVNPVKIS